MTYDLLDSTTLASSASSVTFSSISQDYRDLVLVSNVIGSSGNVRLRYNGDSSLIYSEVAMFGNGSTTTSSSSSGQSSAYLFVSGTDGSIMITQIMDYSATDKHTTGLNRHNVSGYVGAYAHRYASTSAITSLEIFGSTFSSGSTFYLYGIAS